MPQPMPQPMSGSPALLRGVDRAAFAVAFASRLRGRGVAVGATGIESFVRGLAASQPDSMTRLYWTARICLVHRQADLDAFDALFAAVFESAVLPLDPNARRAALRRSRSPDADALARVPKSSSETEDGAGLPWVTLPATVGAADDSDAALAVPERAPSRLGALVDTPFERLDAGQVEQLGRWLETALVSWPTRRTRRQAIDASGRRIAMRSTMARARRTAWEPIELVRTRPVDKPRRVVMLCDVSQSMQAQAAAYLHMMRAVTLVADAEVFAFATTLTRLTAVLNHKSAAVALEQAASVVTDRFGGTRIATNLQALLSSRHGGATRGAVVIIGSDGWDADSPEQLATAMARLRRHSHRIIWMNPRVSAPDFEPTVATMAAALPYCDELLPADTFASLANVFERIARSPTLTPPMA